MEKYQRIDENDPIGTKLGTRKYKYRNTETGKVGVIKILYLHPTAEDCDSNGNREAGVPCMVIREVSLLKLMEHDNIARLEGIDTESGVVRLFLEYPGMDLRKFLHTEPEMASDQRLMKKLFYQLVCGVSYYHSIKAAHGNLNQNNVLIDISTENLKIINLQLDLCQLITYKAPEVLLLGSDEITLASDMFSVGCLFVEMVTKSPLFPCATGGTALNSIFNLLGTPTEENWPGSTQHYKQLCQYGKIAPKVLSEVFPDIEKDGIDLLSKLVCLDSRERITAVDALKHNYFKDVLILDHQQSQLAREFSTKTNIAAQTHVSW